jgi:Fe-S-cluster containining protein
MFGYRSGYPDDIERAEMSEQQFSSNPMCEICGGACCEAVTLDITPFAQSSDFVRFLEFRSVPQIREVDGKQSVNMRMFEAKCLMLKDGRCCVYDHRPKMCQMFEPGGPNCQTTVTARRTPEIAGIILNIDALKEELSEKVT